MGQCGCGETRIDRAYRLPDGTVIAYDVYRGCLDCHSGPAVMFYVFPDGKSPWLDGVKPEEYVPTVDGGESGISVSFFEVRDLIGAAREIGDTKTTRSGYRTFEDWLQDNGLRMIQDATRLYSERLNHTR